MVTDMGVVVRAMTVLLGTQIKMVNCMCKMDRVGWTAVLKETEKMDV